jgi:hypothetical protein
MAMGAAIRSAWFATIVLSLVLAAGARAQDGKPPLNPPTGVGEQAASSPAAAAPIATPSQPPAKPPAVTGTPKSDAWDGVPISCFVPDPGEVAKQLENQRKCFLDAVRAAREARASLSFAPWPEWALVGLVLVPWVLVGLFVLSVWSRSGSTWRADAALRDVGDTGPEAGKPSVSRMIMFAGSVVLLVYFMAFASLYLWAIGSTGRVPPLSDFGSLLMYSAPLFVPYVASQVRAGIQAFKSG